MLQQHSSLVGTRRECCVEYAVFGDSSCSIILMVESIGPTNVSPAEDEKSRALAAYRKKLVEYRDIEQRLKELRKKVLLYFVIDYPLLVKYSNLLILTAILEIIKN
uniref:BHLH domain-containing protein n=1 Tax=Heterorhabditis bacteriophora TaxID=37862 RepID=A0A1I7WVW1_HETBA